MTWKSCAVGMRNAIPRNHLNRKPWSPWKSDCKYAFWQVLGSPSQKFVSTFKCLYYWLAAVFSSNSNNNFTREACKVYMPTHPQFHCHTLVQRPLSFHQEQRQDYLPYPTCQFNLRIYLWWSQRTKVCGPWACLHLTWPPYLGKTFSEGHMQYEM